MTDKKEMAQVVLNAANGASSYGPEDCLNDAPQIAIATICALVDQVLPEEIVDETDYDCIHAKWAAFGKQEVRDEILAIIKELKSKNLH